MEERPQMHWFLQAGSVLDHLCSLDKNSQVAQTYSKLFFFHPCSFQEKQLWPLGENTECSSASIQLVLQTVLFGLIFHTL